MNCENQELIWFKFHSFNNILNSEGNRLVGGKLVQPVRLRRVMVGPRLGKGCRPLVYNIAHKIVSGSSQHAMVPEMGQEMNKKSWK